MELSFQHRGAERRLSPLEGEMAAQQPEGVSAAVRGLDRPHPDPLRGSTLPSRGREIAPAFAIGAETVADLVARDALLDRAMGPGCKRKSSEKLRRGRKPSEGLAFAARAADGRLVGTVRLWDVAFARGLSPLEGDMAAQQSEGVAVVARDLDRPHPDPLCGSTLPSRGRVVPALLLGPLAVDPLLKNAGIGAALMRHAIGEARRLGHRAILLVGDAPYYARFGFSAEKTGALAMPGPYERHRLLALELEEGALDGACGVIAACGRKLEARPLARSASRQAAVW